MTRRVVVALTVAVLATTTPRAVAQATTAAPAVAQAPAVATAPAPASAPGAATTAAPRRAPSKVFIGDGSDGSRGRPVHRIPLRDAEGEVVRPTDSPLLPVSPLRTCGAECHDVSTITTGWHFSTAVPGAPGGRRGEPWILVDHATATVLPLSNHDWPGTFRPAAVGMSPWQFARTFGDRVPGGLTGAREPSARLRIRWAVSGDLDVDCLACHDASPAYDRAEYGRQIALENYRWAATAASGLGRVTGSAREMPDTFDHLLPFVPDALRPRIPTIAYDQSRLAADSQSVFDVVREPPATRCYFCHSTVDVAHTGDTRWHADADLHVARGMTCVDCHRHGLDHRMTRGYVGDAATDAPGAPAVTCRGCHLGNEAGRTFAGGRLSAPVPRHAGLPPIHLTKLSCTACHSGPRPDVTTRQMKTSLAHRLGALNVNKDPDALPHVQFPVFASEADGTITPNRLLWPAYWATVSGDTVQPLVVDRVRSAFATARLTLRMAPDGNWPALDGAQLAQALAAVQQSIGSDATAVYVGGGVLHRLDAGGAVTRAEHPAARPYLWPIAHDVRPAAWALGAAGCEDCHAEKAPLFFGAVTVDAPAAAAAEPWAMARFQKDLDTDHLVTFARTFQYRPWMKAALAAAVGLLLLVIAAWFGVGARRLAAASAAAPWWRRAAGVGVTAACATSIVTGVPALRSGATLEGDTLMRHVGAAPVFLAGALVALLVFAHMNRFGRSDWRRLLRPIGGAASRQATPYLVIVRKLAFWVAAAAVLPAVVSAALALFPVFASDWQPTLFGIHRSSVTVMLVAAAVFVVLALVAWVRRYPDLVVASAGEAEHRG